MRRSLGLVLGAVLSAASATASARPVVAVFEIASDGALSRRDVPKLTDIVATQLAASGR